MPPARPQPARHKSSHGFDVGVTANGYRVGHIRPHGPLNSVMAALRDRGKRPARETRMRNVADAIAGANLVLLTKPIVGPGRLRGSGRTLLLS